MTAASDHARNLLLFSFEQTAHIFTVEELGLRIGQTLHADPALRDVWLRGEATNVTRSAAGHIYFSIKDASGQLRCVLFRASAQRSALTPANGVALVAHGAVRFYERQGSCELVADVLFPEGIGLARMRFEALRNRLEAEGLFDPTRKRRLPPFPRRIGVITSDRGAAIHDILTVLERRYPLAEVVFLAAPVQGVGASEALALGLRRLAAWSASPSQAGVDLIILARGGGSAEDLTVFNDERLVRAIFACSEPVISAVGHETDVTLADLAADVRAPTPSAAAELAGPDLEAVRRDIDHLGQRARGAVRARLADADAQLGAARRGLAAQLGHHVELARAQLAGSRAQLDALSPAATLARGFAVAEVDGHALRDARGVAPGADLVVRLHRGRVTSTVTAVRPA
ncbi:MAG: exodeoxyribonuclease VII large subunit [Chloroflexi bacterium]|nr:exodeoxyribonuclease VII large subunit [Chloroflexota bacterium]